MGHVVLVRVHSHNALCAVWQRDGVMTPYALGREPLVGGSPCRGLGMHPYKMQLIWLNVLVLRFFCCLIFYDDSLVVDRLEGEVTRDASLI